MVYGINYSTNQNRLIISVLTLLLPHQLNTQIFDAVISFIIKADFRRTRASGAGAVTQKSIGVGLLGGMLAATIVSTLLVPILYVLLETMREKFVSVEDEIAKREMGTRKKITIFLQDFKKNAFQI